MIGHVAHCELNEQATAFALHALEPEQEIAVLAHLPGCPSCRRVMSDTEVVARGLAESVEQVDPPSRLRLAILAHVAPRSGGLPGRAWTAEVAPRGAAAPTRRPVTWGASRNGSPSSRTSQSARSVAVL